MRLGRAEVYYARYHNSQNTSFTSTLLFEQKRTFTQPAKIPTIHKAYFVRADLTRNNSEKQ